MRQDRSYASTDLVVRTGLHEALVAGVSTSLLHVAGVDRFDVLHPPPVMPRGVLARSGYLGNFPHLVGGVSCFDTTDQGAGAQIALAPTPAEAWDDYTAPSDVFMTPAACYAVYAQLESTTVDAMQTHAVLATCYRHEPSDDPMRLRSFRMQEFVAVGDADECVAYADEWVERAGLFLDSIGLPTNVEVATDPFFGRFSGLAASIQVKNESKRERVWSSLAGTATALMSANCHGDHFGSTFSIDGREGAVAHSACVAFGLDRIAVALVSTHGADPGGWPAELRTLTGDGGRA